MESTTSPDGDNTQCTQSSAIGVPVTPSKRDLYSAWSREIRSRDRLSSFSPASDGSRGTAIMDTTPVPMTYDDEEDTIVIGPDAISRIHGYNISNVYIDQDWLQSYLEMPSLGSGLVVLVSSVTVGLGLFVTCRVPSGSTVTTYGGTAIHSKSDNGDSTYKMKVSGSTYHLDGRRLADAFGMPFDSERERESKLPACQRRHWIPSYPVGKGVGFMAKYSTTPNVRIECKNIVKDLVFDIALISTVDLDPYTEAYLSF